MLGGKSTKLKWEKKKDEFERERRNYPAENNRTDKLWRGLLSLCSLFFCPFISFHQIYSPSTQLRYSLQY